MKFLYKIATFLVAIILFIQVLVPSVSHAQVSRLGGIVIYPFYCTCSGGILLYIYNYENFTVLPILFQYGQSRLNELYNIYISDIFNLGTYTSGGQCLVYAGTSCVTGGYPVGTITPFPLSGVGTSLIPGI